MPFDHQFIKILTRDNDNPAKDGLKIKKIEFMFNYFQLEMELAGMNRQSTEKDFVEVQRMVIDKETYQTLDAQFWEQNTKIMSKRIVVDHSSKLEDHENVVIVNFANAFIGGGSLRNGSSQEEILFLIFP